MPFSAATFLATHSSRPRIWWFDKKERDRLVRFEESDQLVWFASFVDETVITEQIEKHLSLRSPDSERNTHLLIDILRFGQLLDRLLRNDQEVHRSYRVDILERHTLSNGKRQKEGSLAIGLTRF